VRRYLHAGITKEIGTVKPTERFAPYVRATFLKSVADRDRALAARLCDALEAAFDVKDIALYAGFPIVVRDMEWIAGFAMRKAGPIAYCCSPATLTAMGAELKPYMSGKSCIAVKPRRGETIDEVLALIARAFQVASMHGGMISKADAKRRDTLRAAGSVQQKAVSQKAVKRKKATRVGASTMSTIPQSSKPSKSSKSSKPSKSSEPSQSSKASKSSKATQRK
jgi:hypothetical protein